MNRIHLVLILIFGQLSESKICSAFCSNDGDCNTVNGCYHCVSQFDFFWTCEIDANRGGLQFLSLSENPENLIRIIHAYLNHDDANFVDLIELDHLIDVINRDHQVFKNKMIELRNSDNLPSNSRQLIDSIRK